MRMENNRSTEARSPAHERGFTLLEVMIALAILAGVIVTVLVSYHYHLSIAARNRDMVVATLLGMERIEEFALTGPPVKTAGDFGENFPRFAWHFTTTKDRRFEKLDRHDITVVWEEGRTLSLSSYHLRR